MFMTLNDLKERVKVIKKEGCDNAYLVTIKFRRKKYKCTSHNSMAWDAINGIGDVTGLSIYPTPRKGYLAFYVECKMKKKLK